MNKTVGLLAAALPLWAATACGGNVTQGHESGPAPNKYQVKGQKIGWQVLQAIPDNAFVSGTTVDMSPLKVTGKVYKNYTDVIIQRDKTPDSAGSRQYKIDVTVHAPISEVRHHPDELDRSQVTYVNVTSDVKPIRGRTEFAIDAFTGEWNEIYTGKPVGIAAVEKALLLHPES